MTIVSALVPTIDGREHWLEKCEAALDALPDEIETIVVRNADNWGAGILEAAEQATGDYLWMGSDDMAVLSFGHAANYCDRGFLPAPRVLWDHAGRLQSCGEWEVEQEEGSYYEFPRIPFCTREQFDKIGLLSVHFADVRFGTKGRELGYETVVCRSYEVVHPMAHEGRKDMHEQEVIRLEAEAADAT